MGDSRMGSMLYKPQVRRVIRDRRKNMDAVAISQASEQAAAQLIYLPQLIESQHIAYYLSQEGEISPEPIIHCELLLHKNFYLPTIDEQNKQLSFYSYVQGQALIPNRFNILEPEKTLKPISLDELDVVFVPLVSFDENCNRIGRGVGYYDNTFAFIKEKKRGDKRPLLIGLAYEFQKIPQITPSAWDVPLDFVATELKIYSRMPLPASS